jgi:hypothetical protein
MHNVLFSSFQLFTDINYLNKPKRRPKDSNFFHIFIIVRETGMRVWDRPSSDMSSTDTAFLSPVMPIAKEPKK